MVFALYRFGIAPTVTNAVPFALILMDWVW